MSFTGRTKNQLVCRNDVLPIGNNKMSATQTIKKTATKPLFAAVNFLTGLHENSEEISSKVTFSLKICRLFTQRTNKLIDVLSNEHSKFGIIAGASKVEIGCASDWGGVVR